MKEQKLKGEDKAILFLDLVASSMVWDYAPDMGYRAIYELEALLEVIANQFDGVYGNFTGDGAFLLFETVEDALHAALKLRERWFDVRLRIIDEEENYDSFDYFRNLLLKMAVHWGKVYPIKFRNDCEYVGRGINEAARCLGSFDEITIKKEASLIARTATRKAPEIKALLSQKYHQKLSETGGQATEDKSPNSEVGEPKRWEQFHTWLLVSRYAYHEMSHQEFLKWDITPEDGAKVTWNGISNNKSESGFTETQVQNPNESHDHLVFIFRERSANSETGNRHRPKTENLAAIRTYNDALNQFRNGNHSGAIKILENFGEQNPVSLNLWGSALIELKRYEEAIERFEEALNLRPTDSTVLNNCGFALIQLERYEEAIEKLRAAKIKVRYPNPHRHLGTAYLGLARKETNPEQVAKLRNQARESFTKAIVLKSDYIDAIVDLRSLYSELGGYDKEIKELTARLEELGYEGPDPDDTDA